MAAQSRGRVFLSAEDLDATHRPPKDSSEAGVSAVCVREDIRPVCGASSAVSESASEAADRQQVFKFNVAAQVFQPVAETTVSLHVGDAQAFPPSVLSASAPPFLPGAGEPLDSSRGGGAYLPLPGDEPLSNPEEDDMEVMLRTQETLAELGQAPGRFEELVPALLDDIYPLVCHKQTLQTLADVIVDFAVSSSNVSYTGAQLCSQLDGFYVGEDSFRHCLFRKCHDTTKKLLGSRTPKRRHFTMFVAEIFLAITSEADGQTVRCAPLAKGVKKLLQGLLTEPDDDDIKCVVQVLKLGGWELTCHERTNEEPAKPLVTDILEAVKDRRAHAGLSCQRLIDSVVALQASGWGRSQISPNAAIQGANEGDRPTEQPFLNEPIFYSPDGRQITRREAGFAGIEEDEGQPDGEQLGAAFEPDTQQYCSGSGDISEGGIYDDDPAMNAEIRAAYEQFCEETSGLYM